MKTNIDYFGQTDVEIDVDYSHAFAGHGHWKVTAIVEFEGAKKHFYHTTTNSEWIDQLNDFRMEASHDEEQTFYHEFTIEKIKEEILEWLPISI